MVYPHVRDCASVKQHLVAYPLDCGKLLSFFQSRLFHIVGQHRGVQEIDGIHAAHFLTPAVP
jgi:hypothetical protein